MKVKKKDEFEAICAELKERSDAFGILMEAEEDLMERRNELFKEIILDNKFLEGVWEVNANRWLSILLISKKIKRNDELGKLMTIGYNIEDICYIHFMVDDHSVSMRLMDDNVGWQFEITMFGERDIDATFKFFKDNKMKLEYSALHQELRDFKNRLNFMKRLAEELK